MAAVVVRVMLVMAVQQRQGMHKVYSKTWEVVECESAKIGLYRGV